MIQFFASFLFVFQKLSLGLKKKDLIWELSTKLLKNKHQRPFPLPSFAIVNYSWLYLCWYMFSCNCTIWVPLNSLNKIRLNLRLTASIRGSSCKLILSDFFYCLYNKLDTIGDSNWLTHDESFSKNIVLMHCPFSWRRRFIQFYMLLKWWLRNCVKWSLFWKAFCSFFIPRHNVWQIQMMRRIILWHSKNAKSQTFFYCLCMHYYWGWYIGLRLKRSHCNRNMLKPQSLT